MTVDFCGYAVGKKLGQGSFGQVHIAKTPAGDDNVAMKFIKQSNLNGSAMASVRKELDCLIKSAGHLNVTNLRQDLLEGSFANEPQYGIAMDLCAGGDLFDVIAANGKFPEPAARFFFTQILDGLEHCHAKGVFHRDIKPENIMFDAQYNIKLADFGLSATDDSSADKAAPNMFDRAGTPAYMAPEVLGKRAYNGADADVWSAAVVLFIMLMGSPPWRQCDQQDFFFKKIIHTGNADTFWNYYTTKFAAYHKWTPESMDMLSRVFLPDPNQRATIADLRTTAFMQAVNPTLPQIRAELSLSVAQMNDDARREEEESGGVCRAAPSVSGSGEVDVTIAEEAPAVPLFKDHNVKARTTRFCVRCSPSGAFTNIQGVLNTLDTGSVTETKEGQFETSYVYEAHSASSPADPEEEPAQPFSYAAPVGPIQFSVCVYRLGEGGDVASADEEFVVEFQRKKGDYFAFNSAVFMPVMLGLNDVVSSTFALDGTKITSASDLA